MNKSTIDMRQVITNSPAKLGRHLDTVKSGCGVHKDKSKYSRKSKHKTTEVY